MKRILSIFYMTVMLVLVPFSFVIGSASVIRLITKRPIYYNAKYITKKEQNIYINHRDFVCQGYSDSSISYAKIKSNAYLFKTSDISNSSYLNVYYILPESYFVEVVSFVNSMIVKVQYKNKIGYVSSDSISVVDFVPSMPFLNGVVFDILNDVGTQLRSSPSATNNENIKTLLPAGKKNIEYIASIKGDIPTGGVSNIWYYCFYLCN